MALFNFIVPSYEVRLKRKLSQLKWQAIHLDPILLISLIVLSIIGLFILYSASNQNLTIIEKQIVHLLVAFIAMIVFAQIPPRYYRLLAPWIYGISVVLLALVLVIGHTTAGAKRWLDLVFFHLQPSEMMKLGMPLMMSAYLHDKELPPRFKILIYASTILLIPVLLIAKEPDLGTAIIIACSGFAVLLLAGIRWQLVLSLSFIGVLCAPVLWHFMKAYQKLRVLTFLNPERDPLGSGYHIIQSKIAIGSGGIIGKGWLHGTQSHLSFLPAHATDFIFAVSGEELGLMGCLVIISVFLAVFLRIIFISTQTQNTFSRLLAGSLGITFILSSLINMGMVTGLLPVVGVPLPFISYGGSSIVTTMIAFGIIMSIHTNKKMWPT